MTETETEIEKRKENNMIFLSALTETMSFLDCHPHLVRWGLRPIAKLPFLSNKLKLLFRAFMGVPALELHDTDVIEGRLRFGGVDEQIFSSKYIEVFHTVLTSRIGAEEKNQILYEIGCKGAAWEVPKALEMGQWAPKKLIDLIFQDDMIDLVRVDPKMARLIDLVLKMVFRLIMNEGGWGPLRIDLRSSPMRAIMENTPESVWLGPSDKPVCYLAAGIIAGHMQGFFGETLDVREVACRATGAAHCVFEIDR